MKNNNKSFLLFLAFIISVTTYAQNWSKVYAGSSANFAIKPNGTLWAWGFNYTGTLGDGTETYRPSPVQIGLDNKWSFIDGGISHTLGIKTDGTLWGWGSGYFGELGTPGIDYANSPFQIASQSKWLHAAAGRTHSLAIKSDGTLWAWGHNLSGQLGNSTTNNSNVPIQIGTDNKWVKVFAETYTSYGLKSDGTLWAWGDNSSRKLGLGTNDNAKILVPVQIPGNWKNLAVGEMHALGIKSDGTLWAWGASTTGQLGDGKDDSVWEESVQFSPIQIGTASNWTEAAAGAVMSGAIKSDGTLWTWGSSTAIAQNVGPDVWIPTQVGTDTDWSKVTMGFYHILAIKKDGNQLCVSGNKGVVGIDDDYVMKFFVCMSYVADPVTINSNPINVSVCGNISAVFSIQASGSVTVYQWQEDIGGGVFNNLSNNSIYQNVTTSTLTITNTTGLSGRKYRCSVGSVTSPALYSTAAVLTVNPLPVIQTGITQIVCKGKSTGAIAASSTGGTAPFTYSWNTGATTATISNLAAASYQVTVIDAKACSAVKSVTLTEPETELNATISFDPILCKGEATGTATVTPTGGAAPYLYNWSHGTSQNPITTATVANLKALTYTVTVVDMNRCIFSKSVTITEPASALTAQTTKTNVSCYGLSNGTASVAVSGGVSPYSYKWNTGEVVSGLSNLNAGNYTAAITDANGCSVSASAAIIEPAEVKLVVSSSDVTCKALADGSINVSVTGGTGAYTYGWSNGISTAQNLNISAGLYAVTVKDANACSVSKNIMINEPATKTQAPIVASPVLYCYGNENRSLTAQGTELKWYTAPNGGTGNSTAPAISTANSGVFVYYVSQTVNGCESDRSIIVAQVNTELSSPVVSSQIDYCTNASALPLSANGSDLKWYATQTATVFSTTSPVPSTSVAGSKTYYVSQTVAGCESGRSVITVNVNAGPAAPAVVSPVTYCQGSTAAYLNGSGSNLLWYQTESASTGTTVSPLPSTSVIGSSNYFVSQTVNGCESPKSLIVVQVTAPASLPAVVGNINYCIGEPAQPLVASGTNLKWYTLPNGGAPGLIAPTPITTTSGTFVYYVSQTIESCESARAAIVVQVTPKSAVPVVSGVVNYCAGAAAVPLTANGNNLKWYTTQTGTAFSSAAIIPSTAVAGVSTYYVSQTSNGCESDRSSIAVNVNNVPLAPVVASPISYCPGSTAVPLVASGSNLAWYKGESSSSVAVAPIPVTSASGVTNYFVSQTVNGCESAKSLIIVQVNAQLPLPVVTDKVNYCVGAIASPLAATGVNLKWYVQPTGGIGDGIVPTPSTATPVIKEYYVSQSLNGCESDRNKITVTVVATPAAPEATSPVRYCVGSSASALTATGSNLYWFSPLNGCSASGAAPIPSTSISGTTSYFVSQTVGVCESAKKEIVVIVTDRPQAPVVVSPVNLSTGAAATALTATGTNLKWYTTATGGTELASAPIPATNAVGNTDYYVSQTINGCESSRALIRISVNGDISGPACFTLGGTASYQVNPALTTNAVYYNWWVNGSVQIINTSGTQATVSVGQYYTTGEICVGINYNQAPWNKQVCRKIDLCSSSARLGNTEPEITVFPNPSMAAFTINASEDISNMTIYNALGQKVSVVGTVLAGQDVAFGSELPAGMYVVQYQIQNLKYTKSIIKQ